MNLSKQNIKFIEDFPLRPELGSLTIELKPGVASIRLFIHESEQRNGMYYPVDGANLDELLTKVREQLTDFLLRKNTINHNKYPLSKEETHRQPIKIDTAH